jgi:hypothetical protein
MRGSRDTARLAAVVAVVLGALLLVTLAARSERADTLTPAPRQAEVTFVPTTDGPADTPSPSASGEPADDERNLPSSLLWMGAAIFATPFVLMLFFLRALVWRPTARLRWGRRRAAVAPGPVTADEVPAARLTAAVDEGLRELDQGGPGAGVVASWVQLERAAADAGTHRSAPDTPSELAARLIDRHGVSPGPLLRLADLYREARFSRHAVPETARAEARSALEQLRSELRASPVGGRR